MSLLSMGFLFCLLIEISRKIKKLLEEIFTFTHPKGGWRNMRGEIHKY